MKIMIDSTTSEQKEVLYKLRKVKIDTYKENIAFLRRDCPVCASQGFNSQTKIEIGTDGKVVTAVLDVTEENFISDGEVGLCEYAFDKLKLPEGSMVAVKHPKPLTSYEYIKRKLDGYPFQPEHFQSIVRDIIADRYSKIEMTAFVLACSQNNLDREEIVCLTKAMIETGNSIRWPKNILERTGDVPLIVDKHCIGGLPGNRTTLIVVPIVAAFGLTIPKTSSRAITSPAGTADVMETLANVTLSLEAMQEVVAKENGCIAWGGAIDLSPADDIIIQVERPLNIDSEGQMVASILSKKKSAGSTHVLLDMPLGPTSKLRTPLKAMRLRSLFEYVGEQLGLYIECTVSDGTQPVGRGIGPALEARDVLQVLSCDPLAPQDLREKSLMLAGRILEFSTRVRVGQGYKLAKEILDSGKAMKKMEAIIKAQGNPKSLSLAKYSRDILATQSGSVLAIDNYKIARLAKLSGAPSNSRAGVDLFKKVGHTCESGEALFRIYAESPQALEFANNYWSDNQDLIAIGIR